MPWVQGGAAAVVLFAVALIGLVGARQARSLPCVVGASAAVQGGLHLWLAVTASHTPASLGSAHAHGGHEAWHERLGAGGDSWASAGMAVAHTLAAVAVAVLMQRADAAWWSLARGFASALDTMRARIAASWAMLTGAVVAGWLIGPVPVVPVRAARPPPRRPVLADVVVRRGPPQLGV